MKKLRKIVYDCYCRHTPSIKLPLAFIILLFSMAPLLAEGRMLADASRQTQVAGRIIEVQNQCQIISDKI